MRLSLLPLLLLILLLVVVPHVPDPGVVLLLVLQQQLVGVGAGVMMVRTMGTRRSSSLQRFTSSDLTAACCTPHGCRYIGPWHRLVLPSQALGSYMVAMQQQQQQVSAVAAVGLQSWQASCRKGCNSAGRGKLRGRGRGSLPPSQRRPALVQLQHSLVWALQQGSFLLQQQQQAAPAVVSGLSELHQQQEVGGRAQAVCPHAPGDSAPGQPRLLQLQGLTAQAWKGLRNRPCMQQQRQQKQEQQEQRTGQRQEQEG
jgi:hypothetical protein